MRWEAVPFRNDLIFSYGFGSEHAQEGGRVHRPCTHLGVVRLCNKTSVRCPEVLEFEDDFLKGRFLCHELLVFEISRARGL